MKKYLMVLFTLLAAGTARAQNHGREEPPPVLESIESKEDIEDGNKVYYGEVDTIATFVGGKDKFLDYLGHNVRLPASNRRDNIYGNVVISFVVEKDGSLSSYKVLKSLSKDADDEVIRVLQASPKWIPAKNKGKTVRTEFAVPISLDVKQ